MKYRNENTGFVLETNSEIKAEGWVMLDPLPKINDEKKEEKPKRTKKK